MLKQCAPLHLIVTFSRIAFGGIPRRPSSRLSSRISLIASARLSNASSLLLPWPLAPGISGLYAMNHGPSCSMIAVNSFAINVPCCLGIAYLGPKRNARFAGVRLTYYLKWKVTRCRLGSQRRVDDGLGHACKSGSWRHGYGQGAPGPCGYRSRCQEA